MFIFQTFESNAVLLPRQRKMGRKALQQTKSMKSRDSLILVSRMGNWNFMSCGRDFRWKRLHGNRSQTWIIAQKPLKNISRTILVILVGLIHSTAVHLWRSLRRQYRLKPSKPWYNTLCVFARITVSCCSIDLLKFLLIYSLVFTERVALSSNVNYRVEANRTSSSDHEAYNTSNFDSPSVT